MVQPIQLEDSKERFVRTLTSNYIPLLRHGTYCSSREIRLLGSSHHITSINITNTNERLSKISLWLLLDFESQKETMKIT